MSNGDFKKEMAERYQKSSEERVEKLDVQKANALLGKYAANKEKKKLKFLKSLISKYDSFFPMGSIINQPILFLEHFSRETIEAVLNDLGYDLLYFRYSSNLGSIKEIFIFGSICSEIVVFGKKSPNILNLTFAENL